MNFLDALNHTEKPVVSVIVNTYNQSAYIGECINSIKNQTVDFLCEIVIWDDCSTDNTQEIINQMIPDGPNVHKIYEPKNLFSQGQGAKKMEEIFNSVNGDFFFFIDGDDFWDGDYQRVQKMADLLTKDPSLSMCFSDTYKHNSTNQDDCGFLLPEALKVKVSVQNLRLTNYSYIHVGASCFRKIDLKFPDEFFLQFNGDMWFPLVWSSYGPAQFVADSGHLHYRYNGKGMWSSSTQKKQTIDRLVYACQLTSYMLKTDNIDGALFNAWRLTPLTNSSPHTKK